MKSIGHLSFMFGRHFLSVLVALLILFVFVSSQEGVVHATVLDSSVSTTAATVGKSNQPRSALVRQRQRNTRKLWDNGDDNGGLDDLLDGIFGGGDGGDGKKDDKNATSFLDDLFNGTGTGSDGLGDIIDALFNFTDDDDQWNSTSGDGDDGEDPFRDILDFIDQLFGGNGTVSFNSSNDNDKDDITDVIDDLLQNITDGRYNSTSNLTDIFDSGLFNFDSFFDLIGSLFGNGTFWFDTNGTSIDDISDAINEFLQNITDGTFNGTDFNITDILDDLFGSENSNGTILELICEIFDNALGNGTLNCTDSWSDIVDSIFGAGNSSDFDFDGILSGINTSDVDLDDIQDVVDDLVDTLKDWFGDDLNITSINVTDIVLDLFNTTNVTEIFRNVTKELNNTSKTGSGKSKDNSTTTTNTSTSAVTANSNATGGSGSGSSSASYNHLRFVGTTLGMTLVASIGILGFL